ncbi:MAG: GNAT family N-acetyltransferase [Clostridiales bacterium]|nr:GNAT family N-acetyltransferase [Clostridiales bacterium]
MIIEYDKKYDDQVKCLLIELQQHIVELDEEHYNCISENYVELYLDKTLKEINDNHGKMFLYCDDNKIVGLVVALVNNEEIDTYDFKAPKRGRVSELIISKNARSCGIGKQLLSHAEDYLKQVDCKDVLVEVFAYNEKAIKFYEKNGFHTRMVEMTKKF